MPHRELRPVIKGGLVIRWLCPRCTWSLPVQTPRSLANYGAYPLSVVQKVFDAHSCETYQGEEQGALGSTA